MPDGELRERWNRLAHANRFLAEHVEHLDRNPGDDIISAMLHSREDDGTRTIERGAVIRHLIALVGAGHDTTANTIGHLAYYLSGTPAQRDALVADPSLAANAVEEGLRIRGSVPGNFRVTTVDVQLGETVIPKNAFVYLLSAAAGHDETVFPNSLAFDLRRDNARKHLAFGYGRHTCIGNHLARLQAQIAITELYRRLPQLGLVPGFERHYLPVLTVTGLLRLEVEATGRTAGV